MPTETPDHRCLCCMFRLIPEYRAFCKECFPVIPWKLRADMMHAYRQRVSRRRQYNETLIALRRWAIGYDGGFR